MLNQKIWNGIISQFGNNARLQGEYWLSEELTNVIIEKLGLYSTNYYEFEYKNTYNDSETFTYIINYCHNYGLFYVRIP